MKYYSLFLCLLFLYPLNAQNFGQIIMDVELHENKIGLHDPLTLTLKFHKKTNRDVKFVYPIGNVIFSYKPRGGKKWEILGYSYSTFEQDSSIQDLVYGVTPDLHFLLLPRMSDYTFNPDIILESPRLTTFYKRMSASLFKPGKYDIRITYFKNQTDFYYNQNYISNNGSKCKHCIEKIIEFEVAPYGKLENIEAFEWFSTMGIPNVVYLFGDVERHAIYDLSFNDRAIGAYNSFIKLVADFPESKFAPFAAYHLIGTCYEGGKFLLYNENDYYLKRKCYLKNKDLIQFIQKSSDNPFLLNKAYKELRIIEGELKKVNSYIEYLEKKDKN